MAGNASTRSHHHRSNRRRAPRDYPLGPSKYATARKSVFTQAIRAVQISGFDLIILKNNKITDHASCNRRLKYDVVCPSMITREVGRAQGGVCLTVWSVELMRFYGTKVVICEVIINRQRTPIIGAHLPPSTLEHLTDLEDTLTRFRYQGPIVLG